MEEAKGLLDTKKEISELEQKCSHCILEEHNRLMNKILVIGSSNLDTNYYVPVLPKPGESVHCVSKRVSSLGGKGLNQAVAAARAGGDVTFLTCIGNDHDGSLIEQELRKEKMSLCLNKVDMPSGIATILVEESGENEVIVDSGANAALSTKVLEKNIDLFKACSFILLQNEMPFSTNEWVLKNYGKKKRILYNPSPLCNISEDLYQYVSTLVVNELEVKTLMGMIDAIKASKRILSLGTKKVLLTLGKNGSVLLSKDKEIHVPASKIEIADTVGAGDTYAGYYTASISKGYSELVSMSIASLAAAISVTKKGAFASIPTLDELFEYLHK